MSIFRRFFVFFIILFFNLPVKGIDSVEVTKVFTKVWEEMEDFSSFNTSKLESLDVHDSLGNIDPQSVEEAMETARIAISAGSNGVDDYNIALFYYGSVRDALEDYYLSEYLSRSLEILYQQLVSGESSTYLYLKISGDILSVIGSISISIADGINIATTDSVDDDFLSLISKAKVFRSDDISTYSSFYFNDAVQNNQALSKVINGPENLFLGQLFFRVLGGLKKIFTLKPPHFKVGTLRIIADDVTSNFFLGFDNALNSKDRQVIDRREKLFRNFLEKGQFQFPKYEESILRLIDKQLKSVFGFLAENSPFVISEVSKIKNTPMAHKSSKKKKGPKKGKKKKKTRAKPKKPIGKKKQNQESVVLYDVDENPTSPLEECLPQDLDLDHETDVETIKDEQDVIEFDFMEWYAQEILSRLVPIHENNEVQAIEPHMDIDLFPQFDFDDSADAFYKAVMGGAERPVGISDFEAFLNAVSGGYTKEKKVGSAVGYWLPNLSETRKRNPYLKFTVHLPHNGSATFPQKTLKVFLKRAFNTCNISKGIPELALQ